MSQPRPAPYFPLLSVERERATEINTNIRSGWLLVQPTPVPGTNHDLWRFGGINLIVARPSISQCALDGTENIPPPPGEEVDLEIVEAIIAKLRGLLELLDGASQVKNLGRCTPLFGGRIILGVGRWMVFPTIILYAGFIGNTVLMKEPLETHCGGFPVYVTGIVLAVLTFCTFLIFGATDPGVVPKNYSLVELLAETEDYRAAHPNEKYFQFCDKCMTCRPPRTFHCVKCDICIRQKDLHLRAAGNCVGERNRHSYFLHLIFQTMYGTYLFVTSFIIAPQIMKGSGNNTRDLIQLIVSVLGGIALVLTPSHGNICKLIYKIYFLLVEGRTLTEGLRRLSHLDKDDCVVDRLSVCGNLRNFFCQKAMPSVFRRRLNRVDPERREGDMPEIWILEQKGTIVGRPQIRDLVQVWQLPLSRDTHSRLSMGQPQPTSFGPLLSIERDRAAETNPDDPSPKLQLQTTPPPPANYDIWILDSIKVFAPRLSNGQCNLDGTGTTPPDPDPGLPQQGEEITPKMAGMIRFKLLALLGRLYAGSQVRDHDHGGFTPLFGGRLVLGGGGKWWFLLTILLYGSFIGNTIFMQGPLEKHCGGIAVYVTGIVLGLLTLSTFLIFGVTDPGVIPKNHSLVELLAETEEYRAGHPDQKYFQFCPKCMTCRPPRSAHCSPCGICIRQCDCYLEVAGTCVGERNRRSYFSHVVLSNCYGTYLLATSWIIASHIIKGSTAHEIRELIQMIGSMLAGIIILFILGHGSICALVFRIYLICVGRTLTEEERRHRGYDKYVCVIDKLSVGRNVRNFFCQQAMPSVFRRQLNQVDPGSRQRGEMTDVWILEQLPRENVGREEILDLVQIPIKKFEDYILAAGSDSSSG